MIEKKYWFVLYTKPNQEKKAKEQLDKLGIENYLAAITKKKKWSDRVKKVDEILLKSYIFISCNEKARIYALELPSISRCLFDRGKPAIVPDWQIQNLKMFLSKAENVFISNEKLEGKKVLITEGPFEGIIGVIQKHLNKNYLSISLDFVNRTINTVLPEESVKIIETFSEFIEEKIPTNSKLVEKFMTTP
jgi:transcription antitermination factor NusG